jgi:hypothetical protein
MIPDHQDDAIVTAVTLHAACVQLAGQLAADLAALRTGV